MASVHHFTGGEGALWIQPSGPNTAPAYAGCHQLGDVDIPEGDSELIYCKDASGPNRFEVVGSVQGAAGPATTTVTTDVTDAIDDFERVRKCTFTMFAHMAVRGRSDVFTNFDRTFVFFGAKITGRGLSNLVARTPDDNARSEQSFDISAEKVLRLFELEIDRQTISEVQSINDVAFCNDETCRTDEVAAQDICQIGYAVANPTNASPAATANVLKTTNGGSWAATAADPFSVGETLIAVDCFDLGRDTTRVIVARSGADAGSPAQIAYTDDGGANWSQVSINSTNATYVPARHSLYALDRNNIWVGLSNGYIYKSVDAGLSFTAIQSGTIHSGAWNAIHFADENVGYAGGAANVLARTVDGGTSWTTLTGPSAESGNAVTAVFTLDRNRAWIGYASGRLYYTLDAGATWSERAFTGSGVGQVRDIKFLNETYGILIADNASPVGTVHWTIDGGYSWSALTTPTNSGLNAIHICDEWGFYVVGNANSGTGYIAKGTV